MERDTIFTLPSGTELSVEAALGDLRRAQTYLLTLGTGDMEADGLAADLGHVAELVTLLSEQTPCPRCQGLGWRAPDGPEGCARCDGTGRVTG